MPTDSSSQATSDLIEEARERFRRALSYWSDNREQWREDLRFAHGEQWDAAIQQARENDHRPCFVFNRVAAAIDQVVGEARQNRPSVRISATEVQSASGRLLDDTEADLAKILEGLVRQIEDASCADQAYDTALEGAAGPGFGAFRLTSDWSKADPFVQELRYRRIKNPLTVLPDPDIQEPSGEDMEFCFISSMIPEETFEKLYPGKAVSSSEFGEMDGVVAWREGNDVRVVEYYRKRKVKRTFYKLSDGRVFKAAPEDVAKIRDELAAQGVQVVATKEYECDEVAWSLLSGAEELEKTRVMDISHIPVFLVFGKESLVEGQSHYRGTIRYARDPQRAYNYAASTEIERVALAPKAPFLITPEELEGHEAQWNSAASKPYPYLLHNNDDARPGQRPQPVNPPSLDAGATQLSLRMIDDIKATTGKYDASLGAQGNETSGKAIFARREQSSIADISYNDNLNRAVRFSYRVLVEWIQRIYDTPRIIRIRNADETEALVHLMQDVVDEQTGQVVRINDLTVGQYAVSVATGPSYATQRQEAVDILLKLGQAMPTLGQVAPDLVALNLDVPLAREIAERFRRSLPPQLLGEDAPPPQPTPEMELAAAELEVRKQEVQAKEMKAQADIAKAQADLAQAMEQIAQLPGQIEETLRAILTQPVEQLMGGGNGT